MTEPSMGSIEVALQPFRAGGRFFEIADKFETEGIEIDDRTITLLRRQEFIAPLTRERYRDLIKTRPNGTVGRGFTVASLVAMKILDDGDVDASAKPPAEIPPSAEIYRGYQIVTEKRGNLKIMDVLNTYGERMRERKFGKRETAVKFIDDLLGHGSTESRA
jgi:hypothetical protein